MWYSRWKEHVKRHRGEGNKLSTMEEPVGIRWMKGAERWRIREKMRLGW